MFYKLVVVFVGLFFTLWLFGNPDLQERGVVTKINSELFRFEAEENEVYELHLTVLNTPADNLRWEVELDLELVNLTRGESLQEQTVSSNANPIEQLPSGDLDVLLYSTEALEKGEYQLLYNGGTYQRPHNGMFQFRLKPANSSDGVGQLLASLPYWVFLLFGVALLVLISGKGLELRKKVVRWRHFDRHQ